MPPERGREGGIHGSRYRVPENHTRNALMLAIYERLGYQRLPALIEFARNPRGRIGQQ
jgi:hypothetical protein